MVAIVAFEALAISAALPELAADLGNVTLLPWVITIFLMMSAVATAITGTFVDAIGTSVVFRWATTGFALSSLAAAAAPTMAVLLLARVVQGASGGAIISVGIAAVALVYPDHLTGRAFAANSNVWGVLGFASPAIAAALLEIASWRWIFLIMVPICLIALAAGWRNLPGPMTAASIGVDWISAGLLVLAVGSVLGAASDLSWRSPMLLGGGAVAALVLWRRLPTRPTPLLERAFLAAEPFRRLALTASLTLGAIGGLSPYLPVFVRGARGASTSTAAWSVLWLTIGWTAAANVAGRITDRVSEAAVLRGGVLLGPLALAGAWFAVAMEAPLPVVFAAYFVMGSSVGTVTNAALQMVKRSAPTEDAGRATSAHAFARTMALSLGTGIGGGVIVGVAARSLSDVTELQAALAGEEGALATQAADALTNGFAAAHLVALGVMVVAVAVGVRTRALLRPS